MEPYPKNDSREPGSFKSRLQRSLICADNNYQPKTPSRIFRCLKANGNDNAKTMTKVSIRELIKKTVILHSGIAVSGVVAPDDLERMRESLKSLVDALPHAVKTGDIPKGHGPTLDALIKVFMTMEPLYIRSLSVQALSHIATKDDSEVINEMEKLVQNDQISPTLRYPIIDALPNIVVQGHRPTLDALMTVFRNHREFPDIKERVELAWSQIATEEFLIFSTCK